MIWQQWDLFDLTPEKYDICISIAVVNGGDTGKKAQHSNSVINLQFSEMHDSETEFRILNYKSRPSWRIN